MRGRAADPQSARDAATLLPVTAAILLLPPFIIVFSAPMLLAGIPLIVVYVFGVWATIVLCAWLIARRLAGIPDAGVDHSVEGEAGAPPAPDRR